MSATRFTHAIARRPAQSVVNGLRDNDRGNPTYSGVVAEHDAYIDALRAAGVDVTVLPALEEFPDSVFVEDPALVFGEGTILLNPGAKSRAGETPAIRADLEAAFDTVLSIDEGTAEGGDMMTTNDAVYIGLSERTNRAGADATIAALAKLGRVGKIFDTPKGVLHFKSDCSLLDDETVLATHRLSGSTAFSGMKVIETPAGEEAAANALRVNEHLFVGSDFPRTIDMLDSAGFNVVTLPTTEIGKIDAGLSCMSLRWSRPSSRE